MSPEQKLGALIKLHFFLYFGYNINIRKTVKEVTMKSFELSQFTYTKETQTLAAFASDLELWPAFPRYFQVYNIKTGNVVNFAWIRDQYEEGDLQASHYLGQFSNRMDLNHEDKDIKLIIFND